MILTLRSSIPNNVSKGSTDFLQNNGPLVLSLF